MMLSSNLIRSSGLLAMLGSVLWTAAWILVFTADGTREVFGFSERGWRTLLLNPAMLFFMAGLVGFHAKQAGRSESLERGGFVNLPPGTRNDAPGQHRRILGV